MVHVYARNLQKNNSFFMLFMSRRTYMHLTMRYIRVLNTVGFRQSISRIWYMVKVKVNVFHSLSLSVIILFNFHLLHLSLTRFKLKETSRISAWISICCFSDLSRQISESIWINTKENLIVGLYQTDENNL